MAVQAQDFLLARYFELVAADSYFELIEKLNQKTFSPKDLGISYRELNHWSSLDLLFEANEFGKMRRYNLIEIVWIEIVKELRAYNFPLPLIKELKGNINKEVALSDVLSAFKNEILEAIEGAEVLGKTESEISPEDFQEIFDSPDFLAEISKLNINFFEMVILQVYVLKINYNLIVNADGLWNIDGEFIHNDLINEEYYRQYFSASHISISMGNILTRIFAGYKLEELNVKWRLITPSEEQILKLIKNRSNLKSVTIRFNKESEMELLEYTETLNISLDDYLKKIVIAGGYERIEIITQKGNIAHCERTVKEKL